VNAEVYIADLALGNQQRLTIGGSFDGEPALDPTGTTIAFVSSRSGTPRVWLMDATGANPRALETGSTTFVPEVAPRWSPTGDRIAFTSTRTGTSQVFVVPVAGGSAEQLSHESGGAFTPAWVSDGASIVYMALSGGPRLALMTAVGGDPVAFTTHADGLSEPACAAIACLANSGPVGGPGDIVFIRRAGAVPETLTLAGGNDRRPAFLVP
jgi:TolB protein